MENFEEEFSEEETRKIKEEFSRLKDICYLDTTGSALYPKSYIEAVSRDLCKNAYGNPHSNSSASRLSTDKVDQIRYRILQHFNTDLNEYNVIFTSGATGALKLVAESFLFTNEEHGQNEWCPQGKNDRTRNGGEFVYMEDNHTSVLGMRNIVDKTGARVRCLTHDDTLNLFNSFQNIVRKSANRNNSLFVYSAQCNFSGVKYPLTWIDKVHCGALNHPESSSNWYCLLDAASYVSTNSLDLSTSKPDFVCISFYKIFGYPTGLGALLVKNSSANVLNKTYYGGGTVLIALSSENKFIPRPLLFERFEDGSLNFLSIISLQHGFESIFKLTTNMERVSKHCFTLAQYFFIRLLRMHHSNGKPIAQLYADTAYDDITTQGNIVNFNILRPNGEYVGYAEVMNITNLYGIQLRTGCFCNPGACRRHLGLSVEDLKHHYQAGHVCGDDKDLVNGKPTGSVRVSFGFMNTKEDADKLISVIQKCYLQEPMINKLPSVWGLSNSMRKSSTLFGKKSHPMTTENLYFINNNIDSSLPLNGCAVYQMVKTVPMNTSVPIKRFDQPFLSNIFLYPIKSCGRYEVNDWQLDSKGLKYDRMWMIVNESGIPLTQKREPKLCLLQPVIDFENQKLHISYMGSNSFSIDLQVRSHSNEKQFSKCQSKVCGDRIQGIDCGEEIAAWLSDVFDRPGLRLIRQQSLDVRTSKNNSGSLSLSNQAQYLLINKSSIKWLCNQLDEPSDISMDSMIHRFRSNFVVSGTEEPLTEQTWSQVNIGNLSFKVEGPCGRCQMICIDQDTGCITKEPLTTLSSALKGKIKFGIYLTRIATDSVTISVKAPVTFL